MQLAMDAGARVIGTAGSEAKCELVGGTVAFEELPAALEQMEDRLTTGRIVVVY